MASGEIFRDRSPQKHNELSRKLRFSDDRYSLYKLEELREVASIRMEQVAISLLGVANKGLSTSDSLRYGSHGSLIVNISGERAGLWYDFEQGEGGLSYKAAIEQVAKIVGLAAENRL